MIFVFVNMTLDAFAEQEDCAFLQNHFHGDFCLNFTRNPQQLVQILLDENKTIWCVVAISIPDLATASVCVCVFWIFSMDFKVLNAF